MIYLNMTEDPKYGKYHEGDMILTQDQIDMLYNNDGGRNGIRSEKYRWPLKTVPYMFDDDAFSKLEIDTILESMKFLEMSSCVKFAEQTYEFEYLWIQVTDGL